MRGRERRLTLSRRERECLARTASAPDDWFVLPDLAAAEALRTRGLLWRHADAGRTWWQITPAGLRAWWQR